MPLFRDSDRHFVELVSQLAYCNPFLPERIALERQALGADFDESRPDWNLRPQDYIEHPNLCRLAELTQEKLEAAQGRLAKGEAPTPRELELYEDLLLFTLYHELLPELDQLIAPPAAGAKPQPAASSIAE